MSVYKTFAGRLKTPGGDRKVVVVVRVVLKPLFDVELPGGFEEILRGKLVGKELKTGEEVEIDLLGKPLRFRVILAEPSPLRVTKDTRIELSREKVEVFDLEFEENVEDVIPFRGGFVVVAGRKVFILDEGGQKLYSGEFDELKGVRVSEETVVIIHGGNKIRIVKP